MSPRPSIADVRRPQYIAAALDAIAEAGIESVTLGEIATRAGVSVGALQHYFRSRAELVAAAIEELEESGRERLDETGEGLPPWERLIAIVDFLTASERWSLWVDVWSSASRRSDLRATTAQAYVAWRTPILALLQAGVRDGSFRPRRPLDAIADTLIALTDGTGVQLALRAPTMSPAYARDLAMSFLEAELAPDPTAVGARRLRP